MQFIFERYFIFDSNSFEHSLLLLLSNSVLVLLAFTTAFGVLALWLRFQHNRHERLWRDLHKLWDEDILNVLSGDLSSIEFRRLVKPEHELNFVRFLAPYGWHLTAGACAAPT